MGYPRFSVERSAGRSNVGLGKSAALLPAEHRQGAFSRRVPRATAALAQASDRYLADRASQPRQEELRRWEK